MSNSIPKPNVKHIILTRFCVRINKYLRKIDRDSKFMISDPLNPDNLKKRLALFKCLSFQSIISQDSPNFYWVILVDKNIPIQYEKKLESLIKPYKNIQLIKFDESLEIERLNWLSNFISVEDNILITTNLDDDDFLHHEFVKNTQTKVLKNFFSLNKQIALYGNTNVIQWDLKSYPFKKFGVIYPWLRNYFRSTSCGFSLICQRPFLPINILAIRHSLAETYFDMNLQLSDVSENVKWFREVLFNHFGAKISKKHFGIFKDSSKYYSANIMTNHGTNLQDRSFENIKEYNKSLNIDFLSIYRINWDLILKNQDSIFTTSSSQEKFQLIVQLIKRVIK